jgi:hypothetical protein
MTENVFSLTAIEVIDADNLMAILKQVPAKMRADKTRPAGNEYSFAGWAEHFTSQTG